MRGFDTAYDRLECPHSTSCEYRQPVWEISPATQEESLTIEVKCDNCNGRDHSMFEVGGYDLSNRVDFEVGDELTVTGSIRGFYRASEGQTARITAVADNPLYSDEKPVVGVVFGVDSTPPYSAHLFSLDEFEQVVGDSLEFN